jgi:predicted MFS family arabinose efflux permease
MRCARARDTVRSMAAVDALLPPRQESIFTRAFVMLALAELAYFTADGVAIYTLPMYVTGPLGSDKAGAGLAFGAFALSALVLRPVAGRLCDIHGRLPVLLAGASLCAAGMFLTAHADTLPKVVALRLLLGIAEAAFFVACFAALADLAPPSRLGEALSYNSLSLYVGIALGPPLGEGLVERWGFTTAWYSAAGLAVVAALVVLSIGETRPRELSASEPGRFIHWKAVPITLGFFSGLVGMGGFLAFAPLHADEAGMRNTSIPLLVYGVAVVACRIVFSKVPDRLPSLPLAAAALAAIAAGLAVLALWVAPAGLILGTLLLAVGVAFCTPAFFSAIFATAEPSQRGAASGTATIALDLGIGGGPILLGLVAQDAGIAWAFGAAALVAAIGSAWTLSLQRQPRDDVMTGR